MCVVGWGCSTVKEGCSCCWIVPRSLRVVLSSDVCICLLREWLLSIAVFSHTLVEGRAHTLMTAETRSTCRGGGSSSPGTRENRNSKITEACQLWGFE